MVVTPFCCTGLAYQDLTSKFYEIFMQNMKGILRLSEKIKLKIVRVVRKSYIDILL